MTIQEFEIIGVAAAIAALWNQVLALLRWPIGILMVRRELDQDAARATLSYLNSVAWRRTSNGAFFRADRIHVRPLGRAVLVFAEVLHFGKQFAWLRRAPVWFSYDRPNDGSGGRTIVYFIRWTLHFERLLSDVAIWEDDQMQAKGGNRFRIQVHGGSPIGMQGEAAPAPTTKTALPDHDFNGPGRGYRVLRWSPSDLVGGPQITLDAMSLRPEIVALSEDVSRFMQSREWCEERSIPWRRGWLLSGSPGTGKTSFVRGVAVEHDLPVNVFDLGGLDNYSLRMAWTAMLRDTPCVALIEDIDGVYGRVLEDGTFDPRELKVERGPSFDCLLNCIAGVASADGVLLFVSTNRPQGLDPALRRGGRLDMEVEFVGLDHAGRVKMATRILGDALEADLVAVDPEMIKLSPADLQERLCRLALARRFGDAE